MNGHEVEYLGKRIEALSARIDQYERMHREDKERQHEEVGLPSTLATFRRIHEHEAELVKRPAFAALRARVQAVRAQLKSARQEQSRQLRTEDDP